MKKSRNHEDDDSAGKPAPAYPVPICDFRCADRYSTPKSVSHWRWEFLRRSEAYQRKADEHGWAPNLPPHPSCREFGLLRYYDYKNPYQPEMIRCENYRIHLPTNKDLAIWRRRPRFDADQALRHVLRTLTEIQEGGSTILIVDRTLPLQMQLKRLEEQLKESADLEGQKPVYERERRNDWLKYLRVLDGYACDALPDEIARSIYPKTSNDYPDYVGRKSVAAALKRAHEMQEGFAQRRFATPKK